MFSTFSTCLFLSTTSVVVVVVVIKHFGDDLYLDFPKITVSEKFAVMPEAAQK